MQPPKTKASLWQACMEACSSGKKFKFYFEMDPDREREKNTEAILM